MRFYIVILEATLLGLVAASVMGYIALEHNPQNEFYDVDSHSVVVENLAPVMILFVVTFALFSLLRIGLLFLWQKIR